jgi:hypothetical protein
MMKTTKRAALIGLALLTSACATGPALTAIARDGMNDPDRFKRDTYRCHIESRTSWSGGGTGLLGVAMMASAQANAQQEANKTYRMCMDAAGWDIVRRQEAAR